ncbi:integrase, catalytic region, zinc finger, CCHC-type containing protein [Tanacetum coccineum]|uniref:Integrase, catalytic region, zinc finger, CCHC-type containing protein n=1 Tax=Tanacetum coccineum TaxID=301880 RepID=A0ABQ5AI49_9ASTR
MLAPGNYVQWKSRIKRYINTKPNNELIHYCLQNPPYKFKWTEKTVPVAEGSSETTTEGYMENYKNVSQDKRNQLDAKATAVQIILTGIDNYIYSIVDACPNACEMWKVIERLKKGKSINVQDFKTNLYWEFGKFTSWDGESLESYYSRFYKMMNELVRNQCEVTNHQVNVQFLLQLQPEWQRSQLYATRNRGKAIVNSPPPTYDQEPTMVAEDDEMSEEKEIDKLMALISLSFKKIYKPTNNNLITSSNTSRAHHDNTLRINKGTWYDNKRVVNVVGARENVGTQVVHQSGIQCYNFKEYGHVARECQNPKRAKDRDDTDDEPDDQELEARYLEHPEQPESVNDTYLKEQGDTNITIDSLDMSTNEETVDQDDDDLAKKRDLLAPLIEKLKYEIDDIKNHLKKFQAELDRYHDVNYVSKMEIDCAKAKGDLTSYKIESQKSHNEHTRKINDLNQMISEMKKELVAHQETISIM